MKVLLDENLSHLLRSCLAGHEVYTVSWLKWKGTRNGALLARAAASGFDVMVTSDTALEYEQNLATLPVAVVVLHAKSNDFEDQRDCVPALLAALNHIKPCTLIHVGNS